jgi:hypothetical protein
MPRKPRTNPHPGRMAELYRRNPAWPTPGAGPEFLWVGYTAGPDCADHPTGAEWSEEMLAWILPLPGRAAVAGAGAGLVPPV